MKGYVDFFMLLSPSDEVKAIVQQHKAYAETVIGKYESVHSQAHISIEIIPRQRSFLTNPNIIEFRRKLCIIPPITLTITGFDHFNQGNDIRTIYARIGSTPEMSHWFKMLKKHLNIRRFSVPHITICRNISVDDFEQLWPHFKNLEFKAGFTVRSLTVLQRQSFASFNKWEHYIDLPFEGKTPYSLDAPKPTLLKPIPNTQTSLF